MRQIFRTRRGINRHIDGFYPEFQNHLRVRPFNRTSVVAAVITFSLSIGYGIAFPLLVANQAADRNVETTPRNYRIGDYNPRAPLY